MDLKMQVDLGFRIFFLFSFIESYFIGVRDKIRGKEKWKPD